MKHLTNHRIFATLLTVLLCIGTACQKNTQPAPDKPLKIIVGISPFLPEREREEVFRKLMSLVLEQMPLNASLLIYDAYHIQTISTFDIPSRRAFRSTRTRLNQFKHPIQTLRRFLQNTPLDSSEQEKSQTGAIRFPQWADFIGKNQGHTPLDTRLVVLGNPLYVDEREPGYSMREDYFPSDGHLYLSTQESVYGTLGKEGHLSDIPIHWGYLQEPWVNPAHEEAVSRFWKLYTQNQGGRLETFCLDLPTVFERLLDQGQDEPSTEAQKFKPLHTRVEMIRIQRNIGSTDWITSDLTQSNRPQPPAMLEGPVKVGIRWSGRMDLDLYAKSHPNAETLFFEHTETPEGLYYKDHRQSTDREFEFIEYHRPIRLDRMKVWVNFFEGQMQASPEFEARIEFDRQIYSKILTIPSVTGNQGQTGPDHQDCWVEINLLELLGIPVEPTFSLQQTEITL